MRNLNRSRPEFLEEPKQRRLSEDDCETSFFEDARFKLLTLDLSAEAPCVPEDDKKPVVYKFTVTPKRCALPVIVLFYSLLIAFTGIIKARPLNKDRNVLNFIFV